MTTNKTKKTSLFDAARGLLSEGSKEMFDDNVKSKRGQQEKSKDISGGEQTGQDADPAEKKVKKPVESSGKTATPPGKTPPMGQEPMRSVKGSEVKEGELDTGASTTVPGESMKSIGSAKDAVREDTDSEGDFVIEDLDDLEVGDVLFNEETGEEGTVVAIDEETGEVSIDWETLEEETETEEEEVVSEASKFDVDSIKLESTDVVGNIFEGEELSEDFKTKATLVIETVIKSKVQEYIDLVNEEAEKIIERRVNEASESLSEEVERFMKFVAEEWKDENKLEIEKQLRTEITEKFIVGLRDLFVENYISVPEEAVDTVDELLEKNYNLEEEISKEVKKSTELYDALLESIRINLIYENLSDVEDSQIEKVAGLLEALEFDGDEDSFNERAELVKKTFLSEDKVEKVKTSKELLDDDSYANNGENLFEEVEETTVIAPELKQAVAYLKKTSRNK